MMLHRKSAFGHVPQHPRVLSHKPGASDNCAVRRVDSNLVL